MLLTWHYKGDSTIGKLAKALKDENKDRLAEMYCGADEGK